MSLLSVQNKSISLICNIKIYKIYFFLFESLFLVYLVFNAKSVIMYIPNKRMTIPIKYFIIFYVITMFEIYSLCQLILISIS